ncbi:hypothetical protein [Rhizobium skierniewicense]|uniref:hypothetical protein n=1 Tax=Rhizobium skierniewicense TaxID=984260 RepID=UPI001572582C|nr:hypothetical protein [Rhizobium skierniewicense]NTF34281.1 hypothetical protein [Rhizobium skierniewicense]
MIDIPKTKLQSRASQFVSREMKRGARFSLSIEELADWLIANGHAYTALRQAGMNGIQAVDPSRPISMTNIAYDPAKAVRQSGSLKGVKKVDEPKKYSGGNYRDSNEYRVLRVDEWLAELRAAQKQ